MKVSILLLISTFIATSLLAQSDFVVLKKKGITIQRYYQGSAINFYMVNGQFIEGYVIKCRHDSIFLRLGRIGLVPGVYSARLDTLFFGNYQVHVKDIALIPNKNISAANIGNFVFKLGLLAACVVAGNNINVERKWKDVIQYTSLVGINILVAEATLFKRRRVPGYKLGKKYRLEYIALG